MSGNGKTCRMPSVSMLAFEDRYPRFIFVSIPNEHGRYLRTDPCVAHEPCPLCDATKGEPCKHGGRYVASIHYMRRRKGGRRNVYASQDVIDPNDGAYVTIKHDNPPAQDAANRERNHHGKERRQRSEHGIEHG